METKALPTMRRTCRAVRHWLLSLTAGILFIGTMMLRFRYADGGYRAAFFDDFYYYLVIAEHFVLDGTLSFDGVVWTNGYQPLWLGLIILLLEITSGSNGIFFFLLSLLIAGISLVFLFFMLKICSIFSGENRLSFPFAFHGAFFLLIISKSGMEVCAVGALMAALLWRVMRLPLVQQSFAQAVVTGLLASLMVLARINSSLLVVCFCIVFAISERRRWRRLLHFATAFGMGGFLVPAYLMFNRLLFGTWLPVSGQAKQLRRDFTPALRPLQSLFELEPSNIFFVFPGIAATVIGLALLALGHPRQLARPIRLTAASALLMVPVFYATYAILSDWQLWPWYLYPFSVALGIGGSLMMAVFALPLRLTSAATVTVIAVGYLYIGVREVNRPPESNYIYMAALDINRFARNHPGTYSMGDRAGTVGYFLDERLIQTEGIVMDASFLEHIRRERDLIQVLREYGVRYHIASNPTRWIGCYRVDEPQIAGPTSPHMTGLFCAEPIMTTRYPDSTTSIFEVPPSNSGPQSLDRALPDELAGPGGPNRKVYALP